MIVWLAGDLQGALSAIQQLSVKLDFFSIDVRMKMRPSNSKASQGRDKGFRKLLMTHYNNQADSKGMLKCMVTGWKVPTAAVVAGHLFPVRHQVCRCSSPRCVSGVEIEAAMTGWGRRVRVGVGLEGRGVIAQACTSSSHYNVDSARALHNSPQKCPTWSLPSGVRQALRH